MPALAAIGFAAGLLHVLNHSIFKGLLFLGAGAVQHGAHSLDFEELGGLLKRMPWTGMAFLIGAAGIVGLPPLNGFVSEFLLFYGGFIAVGDPSVSAASAGLVVIVVMGLISGLAAACFAKAFGIVFLGAPRTDAAETAHEAALPMRAAMAGLALLCVAIGLAAPAAVAFVASVLTGTTLLSSGTAPHQLAPVAASLTAVVAIFGVLIALSAAIWAWRARLVCPPRRPARSGLGLRLSVPERAHAIHGLFPGAAVDDAVSPVHQDPRRGGAAAGILPAWRVLCERQRRPVAAAAVRADVPLV